MIFTPGAVSLSQWRAIYKGKNIQLDEAALPAIQAGADAVAEILAAASRFMESIPASASWPRCGLRMKISPSCSATSCSRMPPAWASRCPCQSRG